jgi:glucan phosphoethanolaminetransferase (alkaline phosphatase superfamily)
LSVGLVSSHFNLGAIFKQLLLLMSTNDDDNASTSGQWLWPTVGVCVGVIATVCYTFTSQPKHVWKRRSLSAILVILAVVMLLLLLGASFDYEAGKMNNSLERSMLNSVGGAACFGAGWLFVSLVMTYVLPRSVRHLVSNVTNNMTVEEEAMLEEEHKNEKVIAAASAALPHHNE